MERLIRSVRVGDREITYYQTQTRGQHPSGRPVRSSPPPKKESVLRMPFEQSAMPRLRRVPTRTELVGFHHIKKDEW